MKVAELLNTLPVNDVISILSKEDEKLKTYIEYFAGEQKILNRKPEKDVNRLVFNFSKIIPNFAASFLFAEKVELVLKNNTSENQETFLSFKNQYEKLKADSYHFQVAQEVFAYGKVATLITQDGTNLNYTVLSTTKENIYANFDEFGNLDCFLRIFKISEIQNNKLVEVPYAEIYLSNIMKRYKKVNSADFVLVDETRYSKMPVVFYSIKQPLFVEVKSLLDRYNLIMSSNGDANDYFGNPLLKIKGQLVANEKGETSLDKNSVNSVHIQDYNDGENLLSSDIDYLKRDSKPEAIIFEAETLKENILYLTSTADISFSNLKGLGFPSGFALEMMFLNSIIASKSRQSIFFHLSREINIIKNILSEITKNDYNKLNIEVIFKNPLPKNYENIIKELSLSYNSNIISQKTAIERNPYVTDSENEYKQIKDSETAESYEI